MVPSLGAVDAEGRACSPGLLYGDHRGITDLNTADSPGDAGELLALLGWLVANAPDARGFWPAQAVANHALTGNGAIDSITAMSAWPLYSGRVWDAEMAAAAGTSPASLPTVVPGTAAIGEVSPGLPCAGAPVGGGAIDAFAEQIVAGADAAGDVLVICGATLITWVVLDPADAPASPPTSGAWTIPHTAAGLSLVGGPSNAGGMFVDRAHAWLGIDPTAPLGPVPPTDVPVWLPYVRGERSPLHRRDLRAGVHDLSLHHDRDHLRRAVHEASAFVVRRHLDIAATHGCAPRRIVATGGGTRSTPWMQALADVTGLPVDIVAVPEGAALGSAFIARCVAGLDSGITDARRWARSSGLIEPDPSWREPVEHRYGRFLDLTEEELARRTA
jgi:xylulokinase